VLRLGGCLDALPARVRRVLVLRAGVGPARPHSRAGVARALGLSVRRVARLERRGLRTLRRLDRTTGCAAPASPTPGGGGAMTSLAGTTLASLDLAAPSPSSSHAPARSAPPRSSAGDRGGVLGAAAAQDPPAVVAPAVGSGGSDPTAVLLALALVLFVGAGILAIRRELR
jgi:hypothetical protein